ncbi:MAG: fructose-6-phosphate aldolase [Clostridia bacterium]|nr:fructose-6-phosphate aldolase [Clostridia bacterium]
MKLFIDTANVEEIRSAAEMGIICGVTTNPSLVAREGRDFKQVVLEICSIVDGPVSAEVISQDAPGMVREALGIVEWSPNIVIKIPMTAEGLKAVKILSSKDIKTNVTLVFTVNQALLAARAGATYVSPFVGRLDDIGAEGMDVVAQIAALFNTHNIETEIIAASIRGPVHVTQAALAGADIATVPYGVLMQMVKHPLTDAGVARFLADWEKALAK